MKKYDIQKDIDCVRIIILKIRNQIWAIAIWVFRTSAWPKLLQAFCSLVECARIRYDLQMLISIKTLLRYSRNIIRNLKNCYENRMRHKVHQILIHRFNTRTLHFGMLEIKKTLYFKWIFRALIYHSVKMSRHKHTKKNLNLF